MKRYAAVMSAFFLGVSTLTLTADAQTTEAGDKDAYFAKLAQIDAKLAAAGPKVETSSADTLPADKAAELGMGGPDEAAVTTTAAIQPASAAIVQPSNANPELDARGIPVISDVAYVPPGYNGIPAAAMGGPLEEGDDETYPPCTAERTDNCLQTYERGRSD